MHRKALLVKRLRLPTTRATRAFCIISLFDALQPINAAACFGWLFQTVFIGRRAVEAGPLCGKPPHTRDGLINIRVVSLLLIELIIFVEIHASVPARRVAPNKRAPQPRDASEASDSSCA